MLAEKANYPINMMAKALEVSRSGYYKWVKRNPTGEDLWGPLKEAIQEIWERSHKRFGFRKVHAKLISDYQDLVSDCRERVGDVTPYRVLKCMRELGIQGICPHASTKTTKQAKDAEERPDLVKRDFTSPVPTYKLVGDITYIKTTCGFIYLATVIDLCTRMVVGWSIRDNMKAELVVSAMEMAWSRGYIAEGGIFHSDKGSQYTSALMAAWAKDHDVRLSVGRTGSCHDNAVAESFFGTLKNEWLHHEPHLLDPATTKNLTIQFIESYYNRYRPHEAIDDRVPAEVMDEFFARLNAALDNDQAIVIAA